jgi:arylamine N-acetyltransferase
MAIAESNLTNLFEQHFLLGKTQPGLMHLEKTVSCFAQIPYENLTKIIRASHEQDPIKRMRQPIDVIRDFISRGTGGTCFSLTFCLKSILSEYGYDCRHRMADLGNGKYNHCVLVVYLQERPWLLDPGYLIIRALPIPETGSVVHQTPLRPVLLEKDHLSEGLNLSTLELDGPKHRYYLHGENCSTEAFIQYWKDSFSWNMMHSLLITRVIPEGRFYLHDRHARWFDRTSHRSETLREFFDDAVATHTGIDKEIVVQAREILAEGKRSLREK